MKMNKNKLLLFVWMCSLTITVSAQKFMEKPYQKWGEQDSKNLVTDSAWAKTYTSTTALAASDQQQTGRDQADLARARQLGSTGRNSGVSPIVIRLHSALPVRQALVRLRQIAGNYEKMDETQRTIFDKQSQGFLNCSICEKFYVITISKSIDPRGQGIEEGIFQRMTLEQLKGNIWLTNEKGEKRELVQFNPPKSGGDMAVFYFARKDDQDHMFLTPESKKFEVVFKNDFLDNRNPYAAMLPRKFEFSISKITSDGNVIF